MMGVPFISFYVTLQLAKRFQFEIKKKGTKKRFK